MKWGTSEVLRRNFNRTGRLWLGKVCRPLRGLKYFSTLYLGFRSQSLAPPQALCLHPVRGRSEFYCAAAFLNMRFVSNEPF